MMINRYTKRRNSGSENYYIQQRRRRLKLNQNGEWVKYEDVVKLLERIKQLEEQLEEQKDE